MCNHRNPQARVPKHPPNHNLDATTPITRPVHDREMCTLADLDVLRAEVARADVLAIAAGRCLRHGNVSAVAGHVYCAGCLDKLAAAALARTRAKNVGVVQPRHCLVCGATDHNRRRHDRDQTAVAATSLVPDACDLGVEADRAPRPLGSE